MRGTERGRERDPMRGGGEREGEMSNERDGEREGEMSNERDGEREREIQ